MNAGWRIAIWGVAVMVVSCGGYPDERGAGHAETRAQPLVSPQALEPWTPLGRQLVRAPQAWVEGPSLAQGGKVIAWSEDDAVYVRRWSRDAQRWLDLRGQDADVLPGRLPAVAVSDDGVTFVCWVQDRFVRVARWSDDAWTSVGGAAVDVLVLGAETWATYEAQGCSMALTPAGRPVVAWSARDGVKHHIVHVARWGAGAWRLLGGVVGEDRATSVRLALDEDGRPSVVTFKPGGSYGGGNTTRVFRWRENAWQELGAPRLYTRDPTLAVHGDWLYLALVMEDPGSHDSRIHVLRTRLWLSDANWREISGTLSTVGDSLPALAFRDDGSAMVSFVRGGEVLVREYQSGRWVPVGAALATAGGSVNTMELGVSPSDRARVTWLERTYGELPTASIRVWRE